MTGEILAILLRIAMDAPKLLDTIEGAVHKIEADPSLGTRMLDALRGVEECLADVLPPR